MSEEKQKAEPYQLVPTSAFRPMSVLPLSADEVFASPVVYATYDLTNPQVKGQVYDCMVEGGESPEKFINTDFSVKDCIIFPVRLADKNTGELVDVPCTLITTDAGQTIQFFSKGIWGSISMMRLCGFAPFGPTPQRFRLVQVQVGEGKRMYRLVRVKEEDKPKKK